VLLGPPGSGKGTLAQLLRERLSSVHLSTGELFRREIRRRSPLGRQVSRYVTQGLLVPDALVVRVMTKQLSPARLRRGIVLDGFPRTVGQAKGLDAFLEKRRWPLDAAILLVCSTGVLIRRLGGRQVCSRCGAIYHVRNMPPARRGICDRCGGTLVVRADDRVATIRKRLAVDRAQARPLVGYYRRRGLLHQLNGGGSSSAMLARALRLFRRHGWIRHDRAQDA
jgi:adenylate kinase